jgi:nucleotide-binding universal stress UspA family protein
VIPHSWTDPGDFKTIAVGFVDSEEGHEALRGAYELARATGARLQVVTSVRVGVNVYAGADEPTEAPSAGDLEGEYLRHVERHVREALGRLSGDLGVEIKTFVGDAADTLVRVSREVDLLVIGSRRYGPLRAVALGGVSRRVANEAHCPVIVLPRGVEASLEALLAEAPGAAAPA